MLFKLAEAPNCAMKMKTGTRDWWYQNFIRSREPAAMRLYMAMNVCCGPNTLNTNPPIMTAKKSET